MVPLCLLGLDAADELIRNQQRTKLVHHRKTAVDLGGRSGDLDLPHASAPSLPVLFGAQVSDVGDMMARVPRIGERRKLHRRRTVLRVVAPTLPLLLVERLQ